MRLFQRLDEKLEHMDRELATNPQYVQKVIGDNRGLIISRLFCMC